MENVEWRMENGNPHALIELSGATYALGALHRQQQSQQQFTGVHVSLSLSLAIYLSLFVLLLVLGLSLSLYSVSFLSVACCSAAVKRLN